MAITMERKAGLQTCPTMMQPVKPISRRIIEDAEGSLYIEEVHRYPLVKLTTKTIRRA